MSQGVSILIATRNRGDVLTRSLESLAAVRYPSGVPVEVVVVANACTDDTVGRVRAFDGRLPGLRCVEEPVMGLGPARNRAVREARFPVCAMLDDDIWAEPGWLEGLVDTYATTPAGLVAGRISLWWCSVDRPAWMDDVTAGLLSYLELGDQTLELTRPDAVGANFSFRREVFDRVGPFRSDLGRTGDKLLAGEESFFTRQAMAAGFRLFYSPRAHIKHWVSPHRIEALYLTGVARGTAFTIARLSENGGLLHAAKAVGAGTVRLAAGKLGRAMTKPDTGARIMADVKTALGQGQIAGAVARWRDGPIASVPEGGAGGGQR